MQANPNEYLRTLKASFTDASVSLDTEGNVVAMFSFEFSADPETGKVPMNYKVCVSNEFAEPYIAITNYPGGFRLAVIYDPTETYDTNNLLLYESDPRYTSGSIEDIMTFIGELVQTLLDGVYFFMNE